MVISKVLIVLALSLSIINGFIVLNKKASMTKCALSSNENEGNETPLEKAIRKAKAKAEIKRLTSGPDGIVDIETELKKVTSMNKESMAVEGKGSVEMEERVCELENGMMNAVEVDDYKIAAEKRDELNRMHLDDCGLVLQANSAFYRAFSDKDLIAMKESWLQNENVELIQPDDGSPIRGYTKVQKYFQELFHLDDNLAVRLNTIQPTNIRLNVKGMTAWVSCEEELYAPKFVRGLGSTRKLVGKLSATNLFRKVGGKWLLAHHHATWLSEEFHKATDGQYDKPNPALRLMGNYNTQPATPNPSGSVKKVVMGSLSDILNGGLGNILGDSGPSNKNDNDGEFKTIIHLSSPLDDDEDEEEEEDDDSLLSKWAKLDKTTPKTTTTTTTTNPDQIRQGCIQTLRKLCTQGSLSHNQKRLLLTDIISCSTKGQNSMVEVAFDLLLKNDEDGEEEFADQCRVLADSLKVD